MTFTNASSAASTSACTSCTITASNELQITNSGGSLTMGNYGTMSSSGNVIQIQNTGGNLTMTNGGTVSALTKLSGQNYGCGGSGSTV